MKNKFITLKTLARKKGKWIFKKTLIANGTKFASFQSSSTNLEDIICK